MSMTEGRAPGPPGRVRGRPFEKGQSGNPAGRRVGCRNKTTLAAATLLAGEAEALTRKAVELALGGDPTALRLPVYTAPDRGALQPIGEILLQIRCTWRGMKQLAQFVIAGGRLRTVRCAI